MSTIITATVGTNSYNLTDGSLAWRISDDNLGIAPIRRLEERGPLQNGTTDVGFRLDPRIFHITLKTQGTTLADMQNRRKALINIFKPLATTPINLRYTLDNGDVRQIDCYANGDAAFKADDADRAGYLQKAVVTLKANDPTWYDPTLQVVNFGLAAGGNNGQIPLSIPWGVGASGVNQTTTVYYAGTWATNPIVQIVGPLTDFVITNLTTNEKLDFTGTTLAAGASITIDTRYGYKTVVDNTGANKIAALSADSNLATFHLETDPIAPGGNNSIKAFGNAATSASSIYLRFYNRFIGM